MTAVDRNKDAGPNALDAGMGRNIRERRKSLGMSQAALADSIGLTFQQIQKYERGYNRVSFSKLVEIAQSLGCRVADLIGDLDARAASNQGFRQGTSHLREAGAPELLAAYAATPPALRRSLLKLVVAIAKAQEARAPI